MQQELSFDRVDKSAIAKPHLGEALEIGGDDNIDIAAGRRLVANLDIVGAQNQPPVPWAAIRFRDPAEIETNDKALHGYFGRTDLPSHPPEQHFRIEIIGPTRPCAQRWPHTLINSTIGRKSSPAGANR
jgi:hypothetical protein